MKTLIIALICLITLFIFLALLSGKDDYEAIHFEGKYKFKDQDENH